MQGTGAIHWQYFLRKCSSGRGGGPAHSAIRNSPDPLRAKLNVFLVAHLLVYAYKRTWIKNTRTLFVQTRSAESYEKNEMPETSIFVLFRHFIICIYTGSYTENPLDPVEDSPSAYNRFSQWTVPFACGAFRLKT
mgnify:CR=1 FL=1